MYTLQVFRTKSKDYEESFHKMENFVKKHNLSVVDYAKSNGDKDILQELALLINMHEPEIEKYKELIDTPFDGDTIEDFGKYLFDNIINISGNYHSSLDDLVEELYDSAWENLEVPSTQSTFQFSLGQLTWGPCPPEINISSITQYSNTTIDVSYYIEPNNNEVDEVVLMYSLEC